jgi:hypothetical protein
VNRRISGSDGRVLDPDVTPGKVGGYPACFADEEDAGREVPGGEGLLPKSVKPTRRDVGEIQRGGARPPDAAGMGGGGL